MYKAVTRGISVTVTPASPDRSLTMHVEGSGTSASTAAVWLHPGIAPPVTREIAV